MGYILFLVVSVIWGSNFILMKKATLAFGPVSVGAWRVFGGALVLALPWWFLSRRREVGAGEWPIGRGDWGPLMVMAVVGYAWPFTILPWVIVRDGSAFAGMTLSLVPLATIGASIPILGIYPTRRQLLGVIGGLFFFGILMGEGIRRQVPVLDIAMAATVPVCYGFGNTFLKRRLSHIPSLALSCVALGLSSAILVPLALALPSERVRVDEWFGVALSALVVSSVVATGWATYWFYKLIQDHGPLFAGMTAYLIPLGALLWGWWDDETVSALQVCALAGILGMVALVQWKG